MYLIDLSVSVDYRYPKPLKVDMYWQSFIASMFFGLFIYSLTLNQVLLAIAFIGLLVALSWGINKFSTVRFWKKRAPVWQVGAMIILCFVANGFPAEPIYAASLGVASGLFVFLSLVQQARKANQTTV